MNNSKNMCIGGWTQRWTDVPPPSFSYVKYGMVTSLKELKRKPLSTHCGISFATHLLESVTDLFYIQHLMGHTISKKAAIYLHVTRKDLTNVKSPIDHLENHDSPIL